ncbi:response regulator transcription factor [Methylocaldum sp.]|uniref:response regulator transcription factor n=1 Tax=Methylocaldum sp. TaxID=1969727 RepID=UPI002D391F2A|nr:response regulator transcription factor [Methylocaldum sp.]HYE34525.1 response regulator transcription factor [Methylocaldum sp.]
MIRLLLIDDHPVVRSGYRRLLDQSPGMTVVAEASDGLEGYHAFVEHQPDVVIMDLFLPGIGGLDVTRRILKRDQSAKILVFSMHESGVLIERSRQAGAKGYVTKRSGAKVILRAIQAVAEGDEFFSQPLAPKKAIKAVFPTLDSADFSVLTHREFEVMRHLAIGRSVAEIAQILHTSPKTIGVHQTRILKKLGVPNTVQLAHLALQHALIEL